MHMIAEDLPEGSLQQVDTGVIATDSHASSLIYTGSDPISVPECAAGHAADVHIVTLSGFFAVHDLEFAISAADDAGIPYLSAALRVERRTLKDHDGIFSLGYIAAEFSSSDDGDYLTLTGYSAVSREVLSTVYALQHPCRIISFY